MVRAATSDDLDTLLVMGRKFHAISPWKDIPLCEGRLRGALAGWIESSACAVFVTDDLTGCVGVVTGDMYFADQRIAQEVFWWCETPGHGKHLISAAIEWAKEAGADHMIMMRLEGVSDERMDQMYRRAGFHPTEHNYMKAL